MKLMESGIFDVQVTKETNKLESLQGPCSK